MDKRVKPISDLYFRFIEGTEFEGHINAQDAALALSQAKFIELVPHNLEPVIGHYRDTSRMSLKTIQERVTETLNQYVYWNKQEKNV